MSQQSNIARNAHLTLYVPPKSAALVRTRNPIRPEWLDEIKRPLRVISYRQTDILDFAERWRFDDTEIRRITEVDQLRGISTACPLLTLGDGNYDEVYNVFVHMSPLLTWKARGGLTIKIPWSAIKANGQGFSDEENMIASTIVQMAKQRHLDSLNGK